MLPLQINADHAQRCVVNSSQLEWQPSPSPLVQRRLLERDGGEVARATSVVRYEPGATFERHVHERGEEILVLDGTLCDDSGTHGPGTYLHNPPGSSHARCLSSCDTWRRWTQKPWWSTPVRPPGTQASCLASV